MERGIGVGGDVESNIEPCGGKFGADLTKQNKTKKTTNKKLTWLPIDQKRQSAACILDRVVGFLVSEIVRRFVIDLDDDVAALQHPVRRRTERYLISNRPATQTHTIRIK